MNDPVVETRFAAADAMTPSRFVKNAGNSNLPLQVAPITGQNQPPAGILMESNRFAGDAVRIAVAGGGVTIESGGSFNADDYLIADSQGRAIVLPVASAIANVGAKALQSATGAGQFVSVLPVNFKTKY